MQSQIGKTHTKKDHFLKIYFTLKQCNMILIKNGTYLVNTKKST